MKKLNYLPLVLATGCVGSCDSKEEDPYVTAYESPCDVIKLDLKAYKKDKNAEIARVLDLIHVCDVNLETLSTIGLKKILLYCTGGIRCEKASVLGDSFAG